MPYLIITCGPTGSGKTTLAEETAKQLGLEKGSYVVLLIDAFIENNPAYKEKVDTILAESRCEDGSCLTNPSPDLYKKFSDAYFSTRREASQACDNKPCETFFDEKLKESIAQNKHIVFESTCGYYPKWLLSPEFTPENYNTVFSYSLVTLCNLIDRNKSRAVNQLREYLSDKERKPAPRLPDVSYATMKRNAEQIKEILINQTLNCGTDQEITSECIRRSRIFIFDNNTTMSLLYDSDTNRPAEIVQIIQDKTKTNEECTTGGTRRKKVRSRKQGKTVRRRIRNGTH